MLQQKQIYRIYLPSLLDKLVKMVFFIIDCYYWLKTYIIPLILRYILNNVRYFTKRKGIFKYTRKMYV